MALTSLEKWLTVLSGHSPATLAERSDEEKAAVQHTGWLVLLAILITATSWGIAGSFYSGNVWFGAATACIGAIIVLIVDRNLIYNMDTGTTNGIRAGFFLLFRVLLVLIVSSVTSTAVAPYFLQTELATHLLNKRDAMATDKQKKYEEDGKLTEKQGVVTQHQIEIERLEAEKQQLPAAIRELKTQTTACWVSYHRQVNHWLHEGKSQSYAKKQAFAKGAECRGLERKVSTETNRYQAEKEEAITAQRSQKVQAEATVAQTNANITVQMTQAKAIIDVGVTAQSQTELWAFLRENPSALLKWLMIATLWFVLELLPVLSKLLQGKSVAGKRVETFNQLEAIRIDNHYQQVRYETELANDFRTLTMQAAANWMNSAAGLATSTKVLTAYWQSMIPYEAVMMQMRQIAEFEEAQQQFRRRYPKHSELIAQAMSKAAQDAADFLAQSNTPHPAGVMG